MHSGMVRRGSTSSLVRRITGRVSFGVRFHATIAISFRTAKAEAGMRNMADEMPGEGTVQALARIMLQADAAAFSDSRLRAALLRVLGTDCLGSAGALVYTYWPLA